jgi:hypothetical protein
MQRISMLAVLTAAVWATLGGGVAFGRESPLEERVKKLEGKVATLETKAAASESKIAALEATLKGVTRIESGIGGKPTIQFSGVNVQVVNGEGKTETTNGEGNLVIGYDLGVLEPEKTQAGSHNLVLGYAPTYTSWGGIVAGLDNKITGGYASVTGGAGNTASAQGASVSGGIKGTAFGEMASVTGGEENSAYYYDTASGGRHNLAGANSGEWATVSGGEYNEAGTNSWVGGGLRNHALGRFGVPGAFNSIFGGKELTANGEFETLPSCVAPGKTGELC